MDSRSLEAAHEVPAVIGTNASPRALRRHTLDEVLRRTARRYAERVAVVCGETVWTYGQLDALVDRLAAGLVGLGLKPGEPVGILSRNSHAFVALRFAVARAGAVLVPVNFMLKAEEIAFQLSHAGATVLAVDSEMAGLARAATAISPVRQLVWLPSERPSEPEPDMADFHQLSEHDRSARFGEIDSRSPAQIIYTSGTESLPKGAVLSHEAILYEYLSVIVEGEIGEADVLLHAMPLFHCAQLDVFLGPAIYCGARNVITARTGPEPLLSLMREHRINSFFAPPTIWLSLLRSSRFDPGHLNDLTKGYYGASIMPVEVLKELAARLPQVRLWNLYGQTEIAPLATVLKPEDQLRKAGSCGRPALNVETRIVDEAMNDVAIGEVGEVVHRSPQLMSGYLNDPEGTARAFAGGWFHSGDLATVDAEGYITVVDRKKDMIKTGGENVASREVEEAIYRMAEVQEVAVIGLSDPKWIEAVSAIIVVKAGRQLTAARVHDHCRAHLAGFKCPKHVFFAESLPKSATGKILKRELRNLYVERPQ